ncbi:MAG: pectate lyase [Gemmatales bacterium]
MTKPLSLNSFLLLSIILSSTSCPAKAADGPKNYLNKPDSWFATDEAKKLAANILTYQTELGGWPKNTDTTAKPYTGDLKELRANFDNSATTDELRFLARMFNATKDELYGKAFNKGYDYVLKSQYVNGGWPQYSPPPAHEYPRHITFNDDAMVRLMEFLRETYSQPRYQFIDADRLKAARLAFDKGIDCILKCQIKVNGKKTVWCAQHDEHDFQPRPGRSYELVSQSGGESVHIVKLLMTLDKPSPEVIDAIESAIAWFKEVKIDGIRLDTVKDEKSPKGTNRIVVKDPTAKPLWARFVEIGSNRPIYSDRDGVIKRDISELGYERRNGYSWLTNRPQKLIEKDYPAWKAKLSK